MQSLATVIESNDSLVILLPLEAPAVLAVGRHLEAIRAEAYMHGYNWEAFLSRYLARYHPDLATGLGHDSEGGTYVACYPLSAGNQPRATQLAALLNELLHHPALLYDFLRAEGDTINWET